MRQEGNSLDLNNLPEEYGKQAMEENSTTTATSAENTRIKKKKPGKEGKEDGENVYECRFCSLKFCKSQALGGHMNRHRQERETETLNRARQLVFSNDGFAGIGSQMGLRDINFGGGSGQSMTPSGCFPLSAGIGDPCLHFRPVYPLLPTRPPVPSTNPLQPYMYAASSSRPLSYTDSSYPPTPAAEYYYMGRVLGGEAQTQAHNSSTPVEPNHARLGTSMEGPARPPAPGNWRCIFGYGGQHNSDASSTGPF